MSGELPLTRDPASRYVPWIVGLMMYLASLAGFLFLLTFHFFGAWSNDLSSHFMIEIPTIESHGAPKSVIDLQREKISIEDRLTQLDGDIQYKVLSPQIVEKILSPWIGLAPGEEPSDLPFPLIIEVEKNTLLPIDLVEFAKTLQNIDPEIRILDSADHFETTNQVGFTVKIFLLTLITIFFVAALLSLSFSTTTSLLIHKDIIEILSLLGASDAQIALEFQKHARHLAVWGGCFAFIFLFLTFVFGGWAFWNIDPKMVALFFLDNLTWDIILAFLIPPFFGVLMILFARLKAERLLSIFSQKVYE